jgi:phosphoribosylanthranilate isomerase
MQIKICGITNFEDAAAADELGVDALGFIFYPKSPRCISHDAAGKIIKGLGDQRPVVVGVFVNQAINDVLTTVKRCGLDMIQLHGDESAGYCGHFPSSRLIKALTPQMAREPKTLRSFPVKAFLADRREGLLYGGTGKTSDWEAARMIAGDYPVILAGGLKEENIREAVAAVSPCAVDINSGIESIPGRKDAHKMRRIVEVIHSMKSENIDRMMKIFRRGENRR